MKSELPSIIITGASGFIGRYFLDHIKEQYKVFAIARRSATEAGIPYHANVHWIQWDIGNPAPLEKVFDTIHQKGGADFVLHLAAFYDFDYTDNSAYQRTNIEGTVHIIELAKRLKVKRLIFASSLAACNFPETGQVVSEKSPPDADFAYAKTKKYGEEKLKTCTSDFAVSIVRFAAVFSDWCEYPPVYKFLQTWLSGKYDHRMLGGKGESAVSYIHLHDLAKLLTIILNKSDALPDYDIYAASPDGSTSHKELFEIATRDFLGEAVKPIYIPKAIAYPGILFRIFMGKLKLTPEPFERFWMLKYLDRKLYVDSSYTRNALNWEPSPRYNISRRLLFLPAKMKSNPMITSCSSAWIKFVEHAFPDQLEHLSTCKSPQQMFGVLSKTYYANRIGVNPEKIVTVSVMPCTAKKFEADRQEMRDSGFKDVDYVLTTRELAMRGRS